MSARSTFWFGCVLLLGVIVLTAQGRQVDLDDDDGRPVAPADGSVEDGESDDDPVVVEDIPDEEDDAPRRTPLPQRKRAQALDPSYFDDSDLLKMELALAVLVGIYGLVFLRGRSINTTIAETFRAVMVEECRPQFAHLGYDSYVPEGDATDYLQTAGPNQAPKLIRDGYGSFIWYATGRRYTKFLTATLEQQRRFDLFSGILGSLMKTDPDVVTAVLPLSVPMEPVIACVMLRREVRKMLDKYKDLATYCETVTAVKVPDRFTVVANAAEVAAQVFPEPVRKAIADVADVLFSLHITTEGIPNATARRERNVIEVIFKLNPDDTERIRPAMRLVFMILEVVGRLKLTREAREAALRTRKKVEELEFRQHEAERQEAAQNRRLEKEKKKQEEVAGMSREAQIKYKNQKQKKEMRKKLSSGGGVRRYVL